MYWSASLAAIFLIDLFATKPPITILQNDIYVPFWNETYNEVSPRGTDAPPPANPHDAAAQWGCGI